MTHGYKSAPSNALLTMSWLARLHRGRKAAAAREHARLGVWESEGGSLPPRAPGGAEPTVPATRT
jgi:hypothetical protein